MKYMFSVLISLLYIGSLPLITYSTPDFTPDKSHTEKPGIIVLVNNTGFYLSFSVEYHGPSHKCLTAEGFLADGDMVEIKRDHECVTHTISADVYLVDNDAVKTHHFDKKYNKGTFHFKRVPDTLDQFYVDGPH